MCTVLACLVSGAPWWGADRQATKISLFLSPTLPLSLLSSIDVSLQTQREKERMRDTEREGNRGNAPTKQALSMPMQSPATHLLLTLSVSVRWISITCFEDVWLLYSFSFSALFLCFLIFSLYPFSLFSPCYLSSHLFFSSMGEMTEWETVLPGLPHSHIVILCDAVNMTRCNTRQVFITL